MALVVKILPANAGDLRDLGLTPGSGRSPGRRKWQPTPVFLPGEPRGQRSLVGYSPWCCKESDMTEHIILILYILCFLYFLQLYYVFFYNFDTDNNIVKCTGQI